MIKNDQELFKEIYLKLFSNISRMNNNYYEYLRIIKNIPYNIRNIFGIYSEYIQNIFGMILI